MDTKLINDTTLQIFIGSISNRKLIPDEMIQAFVVAINFITKQGQGVTFDDKLNELCDIVNNYWRLEKYKQDEDIAFVYQMGRLLSCVTLLRLLGDEVK